MNRRTELVALCLLLAAPLCARAQTERFTVASGSSAELTAKITGGSFVATSTAVSGKLATADNRQKLTQAELVVDASSFDTGISLRNKHMREKYLEAEKFKDLRFTAATQPLPARAGADFDLQGTLTIKGVSRPTVAHVHVDEASPSKLAGTARFQVDVTQFGIPQPSFAVVKMQPVIDVVVKLQLAKGP